LGDIGPDVVHSIPPKRARWSREWAVYQIRKRIFRTTREVFEPFLPEALATLAIGGDNYSMDYGYPTGYFSANRATLRRGKPLILWGASVGPFGRNPKFERFATRELKKVSLICARESETVSYLESLGIIDNVRLVSDPAFVLEPQEVNLDKPELEVVKKPCIGINISPLITRYWTGPESWLDSAVTNIRSILRRIDMPVLFVPHVFSPGNSDYDFMKQIMARLSPYKERMFMLSPGYNCREIKYIISKLAVYIGARTHSTIAALSSNIPTISIGYSMKARGVNKDVYGHLEWLVAFEKLQNDILAEVTERLLRSESSVREYLASRMPAYKQKANDAAKFVREIVEL
jgi:polysaccharide pyruvyl transferase WcaK-like protein